MDSERFLWNIKGWERWRIKNGVMEGSEESLVWELQAWEMRHVENQAGLLIFSTLVRNFAVRNSYEISQGLRVAKFRNPYCIYRV